MIRGENMGPDQWADITTDGHGFNSDDHFQFQLFAFRFHLHFN